MRSSGSFAPFCLSRFPSSCLTHERFLKPSHFTVALTSAERTVSKIGFDRGSLLRILKLPVQAGVRSIYVTPTLFCIQFIPYQSSLHILLMVPIRRLVITQLSF